MSLEIEHLSVRIAGRPVVDDVSLAVGPGERLGIIGESGSGKSLTALAVLGLLPAGAQASGSVRWDGHELLGRPDAELAPLRGRSIGMVFQEPSTALDPVRTVGAQIGEPLAVHYGLGRAERREHAVRLARRVHLPDPDQIIRRYPHQLSGGQRQRVAIAIALAARPRLLLADESTTALDVTVQRGIVTLFDELVENTGAGLVFITHDIALLAGLGGAAVVMAGGRIVERGEIAELVRSPKHAVTAGLVSAARATGWREPATTR